MEYGETGLAMQKIIALLEQITSLLEWQQMDTLKRRAEIAREEEQAKAEFLAAQEALIERAAEKAYALQKETRAAYAAALAESRAEHEALFHRRSGRGGVA